MNYAVPAAFLSILSLAACSSGSNSHDQAAPLAAQVESEKLILGLWHFPQMIDEDLNDDGEEIGLYAEYFEITDDSFIFYVTDGMSNCYETDSFPLTHITNNAYAINLKGSDLVENSDKSVSVINYEVTESTLYISSSMTDDIGGEANNESTTTEEYARVINISSQDFNSCTF